MKKTLSQTLKMVVAMAIAIHWANWSLLADHSKDKAESSSTTLSKKEVRFMTDTAAGGLMEVRMGELAQQKGQSPEVKQFAQRLVTDHGKANDELKQLASKKGVTLPTQVTDKHQNMLDKLSSASDFDKRFKEMAIKDHKKDVKEFEKAEKSCQDPDLRAWITKTLPALQEHLRMAEQLGEARTVSQK
jgi:putative membrane protein